MNNYDVIVIGGGSGGLTVAAGAAQFGAKVALIEQKSGLGGDCLHYGCVPSKALIAAAKEIHEVRKNGMKHGLEVKGVTDWSVIRNQIQSAVDTIQEHDSTSRFQNLGVDVHHARAVFLDEHHLRLSSGKTIKGKRIVIATGSSPVIPPIENIEQVKVITNESLFYMEHLPERIVMVGGGAIGMEMAQALSRLGSEITVVDHSDMLFKKEDKEIAEKMQKEMEKELTIHLGARVNKLENNQGEITAVIEGEQEKRVGIDALFLAVGRKPNTEKLQLDRAGVELDEEGAVVVNDRLQSSVSHIYAIGDVNGQFPFTHGAGEEGKIAVSNAVFGLKRKMNYENLPWAFYTQPEIFHLGITEEEAKTKLGEDYTVIRASKADRMIAEQDDTSFVKVILDKKGFILGAHGIGANASDWMQILVMMKTNGQKIRELSSIVHPYPARTEIVKQLADQYWRKKLFESNITKLTSKYISVFR
ncbi:dihydrolipoyl dehydrogenase family protein [Alkalicoccus daliensis]|uniref:Pyruvate/2-oxoglutarate dehydrogenase complex, dihydrolipoamide dehydrogenase (E3) component n=1 Tax=Alkalicoccus daliensis TaxID=745820 RepID=A0A1H0I9M3_9BACI|nr:NAD(P)/FAD-dependent oxidoreductase [Alkalicoccus daliensis]SDO28149.1 Pyruvate/2-oxoglutarate dehydrogenase complex, dihydrolipoamide dehydrogenase (E3) component [Alkalicoccus daliensis]